MRGFSRLRESGGTIAPIPGAKQNAAGTQGGIFRPRTLRALQQPRAARPFVFGAEHRDRNLRRIGGYRWEQSDLSVRGDEVNEFEKGAQLGRRLPARGIIGIQGETLVRPFAQDRRTSFPLASHGPGRVRSFGINPARLRRLQAPPRDRPSRRARRPESRRCFSADETPS